MNIYLIKHIDITMDYSKYYLKNYMKQQESLSAERYSRPNNHEESESEPVNTMSDEDIDSRFAIEGNVEIEVTPQPINVTQTSYGDYQENPPIIDILPQSYDRYSTRRKGWLMTLAIVTCVLLTVVIGDFATGGALLASIGKRGDANSAPGVSYYGLVLKTCDSYSVARMYAEQQRLMGGAGYILKEEDKYVIVGDVYDDEGEAKAISEKNQGSRIVKIQVKEVDFDSIFKGNSQLLRSMGGYYAAIVTQLSVVADELTGGQIDKLKALEKIEGIKNNLQMQYDELTSEKQQNGNTEILLADVNSTLGILSNLLDSNISRPNLVCDVRYSKIQIIINYRQMVSSMSS